MPGTVNILSLGFVWEAIRGCFVSRSAVRTWVKADLEIRSRMLVSGSPQDRNPVFPGLSQCRKDTDLVAVRDAEGLGGLPDAERRGGLALQVELDVLTRKAGNAKPQ